MKTFMPFQLEWVIHEDADGLLIREFLGKQHISKRALTAIKFSGGKIMVDGKEQNVRYRLKKGERLTVVFPPEMPSESLQAENIPLSIVYEDPYLLVISKPAGMNTIPSREHPSGSLANALLGYYEKKGIQAAPHIVTRLDRHTSGLVLAVKSRHIHHLFSEMQKRRGVKRTYQALAEGIFLNQQGTIEQPIGRKESSIIERTVREDGQYACTHYKVLRQYDQFAHVQLTLDTGRTHQIRVHLSFIGHPLLGDDLYGGNTSFISRQALHCANLQFYHPVFQRDMEFSEPLPLDMKQILAFHTKIDL